MFRDVKSESELGCGTAAGAAGSEGFLRAGGGGVFAILGGVVVDATLGGVVVDATLGGVVVDAALGAGAGFGLGAEGIAFGGDAAGRAAGFAAGLAATRFGVGGAPRLIEATGCCGSFRVRLIGATGLEGVFVAGFGATTVAAVFVTAGARKSRTIRGGLPRIISLTCKPSLPSRIRATDFVPCFESETPRTQDCFSNFS